MIPCGVRESCRYVLSQHILSGSLALFAEQKPLLDLRNKQEDTHLREQVQNADTHGTAGSKITQSMRLRFTFVDLFNFNDFQGVLYEKSIFGKKGFFRLDNP